MPDYEDMILARQELDEIIEDDLQVIADELTDDDLLYLDDLYNGVILA